MKNYICLSNKWPVVHWFVFVLQTKINNSGATQCQWSTVRRSRLWQIEAGMTAFGNQFHYVTFQFVAGANLMPVLWTFCFCMFFLKFYLAIMLVQYSILTTSLSWWALLQSMYRTSTHISTFQFTCSKKACFRFGRWTCKIVEYKFQNG